MTADVNPTGEGGTLRQAQTALTEQRIVAAATELFLADGYVATTLEAVARRASVAARTVYVRFGTKAALFKRVIDVAIVGDTEPVDVLGRDWMQAALTAPAAAERIAASAAASRQIMQRTGGLFAVAQQAAAVEPQGEVRTAGRMGQAAAHQRPLLDELDLDLVTQAAAVPLQRPGQVGDRQLEMVDSGQGRRVGA